MKLVQSGKERKKEFLKWLADMRRLEGASEAEIAEEINGWKKAVYCGASIRIDED